MPRYPSGKANILPVDKKVLLGNTLGYCLLHSGDPMSIKSSVTPKVVKLDADIKERLERLSAVKNRSPHWLMKEAIVRYIEEEELNEQLQQETLARWQEAERGQVVSHQLVSQWLDTWGTDHEGKRPPCKS